MGVIDATKLAGAISEQAVMLQQMQELLMADDVMRGTARLRGR
jgi:hypothetical protein